MSYKLETLGIAILSLVAVSCRSPGKGGRIPQLVPTADELRCERDSDCVVTCASSSSCCGMPCLCDRAYTNAFHRRVMKHHRSYRCHEFRCPNPTCANPRFRVRAVCAKGRCRAQREAIAAAGVGPRGPPPLLGKGDDLARFLGRPVRLQGLVSNTKIPMIRGVEVASDAPDLRGKIAEAEGILRRRVVTAKQIQERIRRSGVFAHRGPGTFYRLVRKGSNRTAPVRPPNSRQE